MDNIKKSPKKFQIENTPANNLLMLLGGALFVLLLVSFVDTSIIRTKTTSAKSYTKTLENNYQKLALENADLRASKESALVLKKQLDQLLSNIPKQTKIDDVLEQITKIGTDLGLKIVSFKPEDSRKFNSFSQTPIVITVLGSYTHMAQFISGVANLPYLLTIKDFNIAKEKPTDTNLGMHMTVVVVQYEPKAEGDKI